MQSRVGCAGVSRCSNTAMTDVGIKMRTCHSNRGVASSNLDVVLTCSFAFIFGVLEIHTVSPSFGKPIH